MESIAQIFIVEKDSYLDVSNDVLMPMSWNINDYRELGGRGSAWSKDIMLFGTSNNNKVLSELYDVNITDTSFNKNIKYRCVIRRNGEDAFDGYIRLLRVTKTSPSSTVFDENVIYQVQIYDAVASFNQDIQKKYLEDIDLSQYDHTFNLTGITSTSANTWNQGYKYHNFYKATEGPYEFRDYHVSVFAPVYFDRIFSGANYTYNFDSLSATGFDRTIVPWNGDKSEVRKEVIESRSFYVGFTADTGYVQCDLTGATIIYNDEDNIIHFDSGNTYNPSTGVFSPNYNETQAQFKTRFKYELYFSAATAASTALNVQIRPTVFLVDGTSTVGYYGSQFYNQTYPAGTIIPSGLTLINSGVTNELVSTLYGSEDTQIYNGQNLKNVIKMFLYADNWKISGTTDDADVRVMIRIAPDITFSSDTQNYWQNMPKITDIGQGDTIYVNDFIPKKQEQSKFITSVVRKYNLFFVPSKDIENHMNIYTRDEYFDSGNVWNFDLGEAGCYLSTEDNYQIEWVHDKQNKIIRLKDKDDSDVFNEQYLKNIGETYGQIDYVFENQHIQGVNVIETDFSPTPINEENAYNNLVSMIPTQNPKGNIRLLYDCGWITGNTWEFKYKNGIDTVVDSFSTYPAALHFYPDPIDPDMDLNFGLCDYLYYNRWTQLTNNNQYNRFWSRHFSQLENGRILTGLFKLTDRFIRQFKMNDRIYCLGTYWNINSITDYDFNSESLTKMELIEIDEGLKFAPLKSKGFSKKPSSSDFAALDNFISNDFVDNGGNNFLSGDNVNVRLAGPGNIIGYGVRNAFIAGSGNTITGSDSVIFGKNNTIDSGATNVRIFGDNISVDESGSGNTYVDNIIITESLTLQSGATLNLSGISISGLDYLPLSGGSMTGNIQFPVDKGLFFNNTVNGVYFDEVDLGFGSHTGVTINAEAGNTYALIGTRYDGGIELGSFVSNSLIGIYTKNTTLELYDTGEVNFDASTEMNIYGGTKIILDSPFTGGTALYTLNLDSNGVILTGATLWSAGTTNSVVGGQYSQANPGQNSLVFGGTFSNGANSTNSNNSVVIGGYNNTITTSAAVGSGIFAGYNNLISGGITGNTIIGGVNNSINAVVSTIVSSSGSSIGSSASGAAIIGGGSHSVTHNRSVIIGGAGISSAAADTVYVPNLKVNNDTALAGDIIVTGSITATTLTAQDFNQSNSAELSTLNATVQTLKTISTESDTAYQIEANTIGRKSDGSQVISSKILATYKNDSGVLSLVGSQNTISNSDFTTASISMDISGTNIRIRITGEAATTISWGTSVIINKI